MAESTISGMNPVSLENLASEVWVEISQRNAGGTFETFRFNIQQIQGAKGDEGDQGPEGLSAYQLAVQEGFTGTEAEWLNSLGGKNAYDIAVENGFEGTQEDWLNSLVGKDAFTVAQEAGFSGTKQEWLDALKGETAYELYVASVPDGETPLSEADWLNSLKAKNPYELYLDSVPDGETPLTQEEWVESLKGPDGKTAYDLYVDTVAEGETPLTLQQWLDSLKGDSGSGLRILGSFPSTDFLPSSGNASGDAYIINYVMWVWDSVKWAPVGQVGPTGKSAYQVAVDMGFEGSQREWLESLKGDDAYTIAKELGFEGTKSQWIASLNGKDGADAYGVYLETVADGETPLTRPEWLLSLVGPKGEQGDPGEQGEQGEPANAIAVLGALASTADYPTDPSAGDAYFIEETDGEGQQVLALHVYTGEGWVNVGPVSGPQGVKGDKGDTGDAGADGKSAYELAQDQGFAGSVAEFITSLKGDTGESAYEIAVRTGVFNGTEAEWLTSLKGENGESAYDIAIRTGVFNGTEEEFIVFLKGEEGDRGVPGPPGDGLQLDGVVDTAANLPTDIEVGTYAAYIALDTRHLHIWRNGQWDDAGEFGGPSAYDIAAENGFEGTVEEWLTSLVGEKGDPGDKGDQGEQGVPGPAFQVTGVVDTANDLPTDAEDGTGYISQDDGHFHARVAGAWVDTGTIVGPKGDKGDQGDQGVQGEVGDSIYDVAVANGFTGTEAEFLQTLVGQSAYEIAVTQGFSGHVDQWLASLKGDQGEQGEDGQSAFALAQTAGFTGTEAEWLASLNGKSAYDLYVDTTTDDPVMSLEQWQNSLVGPAGEGMNFKGNVASEAELPTEGNENGDTYGIDGHLWSYNAVDGAFKDMGDFSGPPGDKGDPGDKGETGDAGPSAYQSYLNTTSDDPVLSEADWVASLEGGDIYELYLSTVPDGETPMTESEYLQSLVGASAYQAYVDTVPDGETPLSQQDWVASLRGETGLSAYQVYVANTDDDPVKTEQEWLSSLNGNRWIIGTDDPSPVTGNVQDLYFNTTSQEAFQKVNDSLWASIGNIGGGNVYDAPVDGEQYVRKDGDWAILQAEVEEAPQDGTPYVRQDAAWVAQTAEVEEAPEDGNQYGRKDGVWAVITAEVEEAPTVEEGQPTAYYMRSSAGEWTALQLATVADVKAGTAGNLLLNAETILAVFNDMGITYDAGTDQWTNDEGYVPSDGGSST